MRKLCLLSGGTFDLLNPEESTFTIEDIAHALSNLCRFGGQVQDFYSVAQHSVLVSYMVPREYALDGLLHDAAEAFLGDIINPVKAMLKDNYQPLEDKAHRCIAKKYSIAETIPLEVKTADQLALVAEVRDLTSPALYKVILDGGLYAPGLVPGTIIPVPPAHAKLRFMKRFAYLTEGRNL